MKEKRRDQDCNPARERERDRLLVSGDPIKWNRVPVVRSSEERNREADAAAGKRERERVRKQYRDRERED